MPYSDLKHGNRKNGCFEACGTPTPNLGGAYFGRSRGDFEAYAKIGWVLAPEHRISKRLHWVLNQQCRGSNGVVW